MNVLLKFWADFVTLITEISKNSPYNELVRLILKADEWLMTRVQELKPRSVALDEMRMKNSHSGNNNTGSFPQTQIGHATSSTFSSNVNKNNNAVYKRPTQASR